MARVSDVFYLESKSKNQKHFFFVLGVCFGGEGGCGGGLVVGGGGVWCK